MFSKAILLTFLTLALSAYAAPAPCESSTVTVTAGSVASTVATAGSAASTAVNTGSTLASVGNGNTNTNTNTGKNTNNNVGKGMNNAGNGQAAANNNNNGGFNNNKGGFNNNQGGFNNKGGFNNQGGFNNNKGNNGKASSSAVAATTAAGAANTAVVNTATAVLSTSAAAASSTGKVLANTGNNNNNAGNAANNNNTGNAGNANNGDPQTSTTLDPRVIATGFENDGQSPPVAGQVASATSGNNFINFCLTVPQLPITNGQQIVTGSCNPAPMGVIAAQAKMPSTKFSFPPNGGTVKSNTAFTFSTVVRQFTSGNFVNANANYFSAPQTVDGNGFIVGHSHITVQKLDSLGQTTAQDPTVFAFFKGLNDKAQNGVLSADVTAGLPAGVYKASTIMSAANHQPCLVAVAQHGSLDDAIYFFVTDDGQPPADGFAGQGAAAGAQGAQGAAGAAGAQGAQGAAGAQGAQGAAGAAGAKGNNAIASAPVASSTSVAVAAASSSAAPVKGAATVANAKGAAAATTAAAVADKNAKGQEKNAPVASATPAAQKGGKQRRGMFRFL